MKNDLYRPHSLVFVCLYYPVKKAKVIIFTHSLLIQKTTVLKKSHISFNEVVTSLQFFNRKKSPRTNTLTNKNTISIHTLL